MKSYVGHLLESDKVQSIIRGQALGLAAWKAYCLKARSVGRHTGRSKKADPIFGYKPRPM